MKKLTIAVRILFGVMLLALGAAELLRLSTAQFTGNAQLLIDALAASGYFFPIIGGIEIVAGLSLLTNRFVPLALLLLTPISINFVLFHLFLELPSIGASVVIFLFHLYLLFAHLPSYRPILKSGVNG